MDNVLFIGNGFDLHNGLKTKYTDYLDSLDQKIISQIILKILVDSVDKIYFIDQESFNSICNSKIKREVICIGDLDKIVNIFTINSKNQEYSKEIFKSRMLDFKKLKYEGITISQYNLSKEEKEYIILACIKSSFEKAFQEKENYYICNVENSMVSGIDAKTKHIIDVFIDKYQSYKNIDKHIIIETLQQEINSPIKPNNFFELYLEILRNNLIKYSITELNAGENWIDVENILYENQFSYFRSRLRYYNDKVVTRKEHPETLKNILKGLEETNQLKYEEFIKDFDKLYNNKNVNKNITVLEDFNNFKEKFAKYVEEEQKKIDANEVTKFYKKLDERYDITRVYNFNYSNYLNDIVDTHNKTNNKTTTIQNIHGDITNGKDIVFGTNHYMFLEDLKQHNKYLENTNLTQYLTNEEEEFKLTKMFQVMKIVGNKPPHSFNKVNSLTLLGHSIGIQDYEYIHSIIKTNPSNIKLNIIWTSWEDENGAPKNNLEELTSGLYKMLGKYEQLYDDLSLHKMLLENRISFINIDEIHCTKKHRNRKRKTKTNPKNRNKKVIKLNK